MSNANCDNALSERIHEAFGPDGPGVLWVTGPDVQEQVRWIRRNFLPQAAALTSLTGEERGRLVDPDSPLTNGLSRGAEVTDRAKSSFYYHPVTDTPARYLPPGERHVPVFHNPSLFPAEHVLPDFKAAARRSARYIVGVGHALAQVVERHLAEHVPGYAKGALTGAMCVGPESNHKCRLLHYHPFETPEEVQRTGGKWAAPHLDTGSLTGLVPDLYVDAQGVPTGRPDPGIGLYVLDRRGNPLAVEPPADVGEALLFQVGESLQIISGGELQATPHYVQGPAAPDPGGAGRCALAVFMQPQPHQELPIPAGMTHAEVAARSADRHLPEEWPTLAWRFARLREEGMLGPERPLTFGSHGHITFSNLGATRDDS